MYKRPGIGLEIRVEVCNVPPATNQKQRTKGFRETKAGKGIDKGMGAAHQKKLKPSEEREKSDIKSSGQGDECDGKDGEKWLIILLNVTRSCKKQHREIHYTSSLKCSLFKELTNMDKYLQQTPGLRKQLLK
ncbi:hypothetical protein DV515_00009812 [Chloebia gouldiae]|uniref:Uncharacterized protein n=1 Tax=Chloebia gouldiae TaxID=44316 RepID=A0A3L8SBG8_CHLGU|nr:hypothetical protein DV515_00009812 [Chloebia gouldiae]